MPIDPHAIKEIDFTNLDNVEVSSISEGLYCGRRFSINDSAEGVIFNDLFRKARKLSRQADNPDKLAQVKAFIGKLRTVEGTATEQYEAKDCLYKFKSWFHRLFGGAFFGSHLERLDVLEGKVDTLKHKMEVTIVRQELQLIWQQLPLSVLTSCLGDESITLPWKEGSVIISYNSESEEIVFTTSDHKKLSINIYESLSGDFGEFKELSGIIEGLCQEASLRPSYEHAFSERASYDVHHGTHVTVRVVREEMKIIPAWHLHQITKIMSSSPNLDVQFLNSSLGDEEGTDEGGLSRDYVATLIEEVKNLKQFFCMDNGSLALPRVNGSMTPEASQIYFDLGKMLGTCYRGRQLVSGCYFNHALFNAAKKLPSAQLHLPFDSVLKKTRGKMAQEVIKELDKDLGASNALLFKVLDLLDEVNLQDALNNEKEQELNNAIVAAEIEYLTEDFTVDFEKIRANPSGFIDELYESIMNNPHLVTELNGTSLHSIIEPIHRVAQGLGEAEWHKMQNDPDLIPKIQGVMDRNTVANAIKRYCFVPEEKINWLKDWIKEEASEAEVRSFLKYVTGASSLQRGTEIHIENGSLPYPVAHTCSNVLEISPNMGSQYKDGTKEGFIENLKGAISVTGFQMD